MNNNLENQSRSDVFYLQMVYVARMFDAYSKVLYVQFLITLIVPQNVSQLVSGALYEK